jgi:hypothetical protein
MQLHTKGKEHSYNKHQLPAEQDTHGNPCYMKLIPDMYSVFTGI